MTRAQQELQILQKLVWNTLPAGICELFYEMYEIFENFRKSSNSSTKFSKFS